MTSFGDGFRRNRPPRPPEQHNAVISLLSLHPSLQPRLLCGYLCLNCDRRMNQKRAVGVWSGVRSGVAHRLVSPLVSPGNVRWVMPSRYATVLWLWSIQHFSIGSQSTDGRGACQQVGRQGTHCVFFPPSLQSRKPIKDGHAKS